MLSHVAYSPLAQHEADVNSDNDVDNNNSNNNTQQPLRCRSQAVTPNNKPQQHQQQLSLPPLIRGRAQSDPSTPHPSTTSSIHHHSNLASVTTPITGRSVLLSPLSAPASSNPNTMLSSSPASYFRRVSPASSAHSDLLSPSRSSLLLDSYSRTLFFCLLFIFLFFTIFTIEYVHIDRLYHRDELARLELTTQTLSQTIQQLDTKTNELTAATDELEERDQAMRDLHSQLSQRDEALLMYRQLVVELQEKSEHSSESEQTAKLLQSHNELLNKTSFLFGPPKEKATVETVTRLTEGGAEIKSGKNSNGSGAASEGGAEIVATRLVDSDNNEYILSSPSDSSLKSVDGRLILDLGIVIISAAIGGLLSSFLHQPPLLGYLLAGSAIGPGGLRLIGQFVQVETLAEFGATFLLFALGVEFSFAKLSRVRNVAVGSGTLMMALMVCVVAAIGYAAVGVSWGKGLFIGAVLSMSSTTVVVKSLMERKQLTSRVGQVMLGLLIVQDIFLSLLLSILTLASSPPDELLRDIGLHLLKFAVLAVIVVCCAFLWPLALRMLDYSRSHDLVHSATHMTEKRCHLFPYLRPHSVMLPLTAFLLGLVALCVTLTVVADRIIGSAEVGAFLAGILVSSSPTASPELTKRSLRLFEPIRDMFGALFFSSMGMLINPAFLLHNWAEVIALVVVTVTLKCVIGWLCARLWGQSSRDALHISLCLSQIGEFAFVLASQGLRAELLVRDDYMLLLGVTAVSIFCTPGLIAASFWVRRALAVEGEVDDSEMTGGASGGGSMVDAASETEVLTKESGWSGGEMESLNAAADSRSTRARHNKEKRSDAEFIYSHYNNNDSNDTDRHTTAPAVLSAVSMYGRGQQHGLVDEDAELDLSVSVSSARRVLAPAYPLKRGHSAVVAAETKEEESSGTQQSNTSWKERRRQRQLEQRARQYAAQQAEQRQREAEEREGKERQEQVRIRMGDERKDWRGDQSLHR